jgi:arylsulfatase A
MDRRRFLHTAAASAAGAALARGGPAAPAAPPNFLFILADDLGAKELGCYGNQQHATPQLDTLAAGGTLFKTCYVTPICSPTRVEVMTGRYGFRTGWYNLIGRPYAPRPDDPQYDIGRHHTTFAEVLKSSGYATALAGKWQLSGEHPTLIRDCGFDEYCMWAYTHNLPAGVRHTGAMEGGGRTARYWHPCLVQNGEYRPTTPDDYGPDIQADFLIDFMRRHRDRPFVAYHPCCLTHDPHLPTPASDPAKLTSRHQRSRDNFKDDVEYLDRIVGRLVKALDDLGLRQRTVVFFVGDNGTGGQGKGTATELGARVPCIVNCPGLVKAGVRSDELVDGSDMLPTLAALAGAPLPAAITYDGRSFAHLLTGEPGPTREWIFSYLEDKRILRDKRWLREGDGRVYDCGASRDGAGYRDVTTSDEAEAVAARARFERILADLPAPATQPRAGQAAGRNRQGPAE